ncbi:MAG TPA: serine hydrolase domain-containing protein [Pyrinomonadaceae bacterium]
MRHAPKLATALAALMLASLVCPASAGAQRRFSTGAMPPPRFADPERGRKLAAAFPEIERQFTAWVERRRMPGAVMGVIVDGELAWVKAAGVQDTQTRAPVTPDSLFRIASMTKSFTAMAVLKLRDEGKLSLDDPVSRYVPALAGLPYPTKDSPAITVRHLLTHSEGFPEDNPWGDRQLAQTDETMRAWMRAGIPFSNAPGVAFEYSNYGFAILGQVVARASGRPYAQYVREEILRPLGMSASTFEVGEIPRGRVAAGYRLEGNEWKAEALLPHGSFGPMGGLWTSARDLARYVAFLMSAFPPRDDPERGPVSRASAREMQQAWRAEGTSVFRNAVDEPLQLSSYSYGFGLGVTQDCRHDYIVGHSGGLPGYGSLMRWLPEYGVGLIAMGNVTYAGWGGMFNDAVAALHRTGALQKRTPEPSPALLAAQSDVSQLVNRWDDALAARIAADNFFMDEPAPQSAASFKALTQRHGVCRADGKIDAENALRGSWKMPCERGWMNVSITLAPTSPPRVQSLQVQSVMPPSEEMNRVMGSVVGLLGSWDAKAAEALAAPGLDLERMRRQFAAAAAWGQCRAGEALSGDGRGESAFRLNCANGRLAARLSLDAATHRLKGVNLLASRLDRCVP